jgi:hypothetical protein
MENNVQKSVEWFAERLGKFTASEIYKLIPVGRNKIFTDTGYKYILQKAGEKLTGQVESNPNTIAMQWGTEHEPLARHHYTVRSGNPVKEVGFIQYLDENLGGSPDGVVVSDGGSYDRIIEIKCPYSTASFLDLVLSLKTGNFKADYPQYYWQVVLNMLVTNTTKCDFVCFDPRIDSDLGLFICEVQLDNHDTEMLLKKVALAQTELFNIYLLLIK